MAQHESNMVAYSRLSSLHLNLGRQLEAMGGVDRVFEEDVPGGSCSDRVALLACVREGDVVKAASTDRLARSLGQAPCGAVRCDEVQAVEWLATRSG